MSTNVMVRDLDIAPPHRCDLRRLEVVAEGLILFGGCQLAIDAIVVSPLHSDGTHRRRADAIDGQVLGEARKLKERTYPELCQRDGRARLVVVAGEVGEDGPMKRRRCCGPCHARRPLHFREGCTAAHKLRGSDGGVVFWRVPQLRQSLHPCWV